MLRNVKGVIVLLKDVSFNEPPRSNLRDIKMSLLCKHICFRYIGSGVLDRIFK